MSKCRTRRATPTELARFDHATHIVVAQLRSEARDTDWAHNERAAFDAYHANKLQTLLADEPMNRTSGKKSSRKIATRRHVGY